MSGYQVSIYSAIRLHAQNSRQIAHHGKLVGLKATIFLTIQKDIKEYITDQKLKEELMNRVTPEKKEAPTRPEQPAPVRMRMKKPNS
ncbi:MAG: hypothetical protein O9346_16550 [Leptospiraceae bacterium]|nr:hypothetical protein [Leptospiraceae bacterium]MCZ8348024.1 hypothetical protein [Leptospiraceae bacterium]